MSTKLSERTDEAGLMSRDMVRTMIGQIEKLKEIKSLVLAEKRKAIAKVNQQYRAELSKVEKDIYNVENAIKQIAGAKEYHKIKRRMKEEEDARVRAAKAAKKTKDINTADANDNANNNNNDNSEGVSE